MSEKLVIFCIPLSYTGHINASVGLCLQLKRNGHKIVFGVEKTWKGKFEKYGFEEEIYEEAVKDENEKPMQLVIEQLEMLKKTWKAPAEEEGEVVKEAFIEFCGYARFSNQRIQQIIAAVKPDIIIQDNYVTIPAIVNSKVPFVILHSCNPLYGIECDSVPPAWFGLPLNDSSDWQRCRQIHVERIRSEWEKFSAWIVEQGAPALPENRFQYTSPYLNVVMFPKVLFEDYSTRAKLGKEWMLIEHAVRESNEDFDFPETFKQKPGKLIYLSLGSMVSADTDLLQRLINILAKSPHKVVVSMGLQHEKIKLAENMWGDSYVPQLKILPICDLFITHGGNNSLIEALYFGVPMIVMPAMMDQHDNAQRVVETKVGKKAYPYTVTEEELLTASESLLNDETLSQRLKTISEEIKNSTSMTEVTKRIEQIAADHKQH